MIVQIFKALERWDEKMPKKSRFLSLLTLS